MHGISFAGREDKPEDAAASPDAEVVPQEVQRIAVAIRDLDVRSRDTGDDLGDGTASV